MEAWQVLAAAGVLILFISWVYGNAKKAKLYDQLGPRVANLDAAEAQFQREKSEWAQKKNQEQEALHTLAGEKSQGFPWLAEAYADYFYLDELRTATHLETKRHPAMKSAEHVRESAARRRTAEKLWRVLKYQLQYYESLFPWLVDFKGEDLDDLICQLVEKTRRGGAEEEQDQEDPARHWLTDAEYRNLPIAEKYQLALDRYWQKKKYKWEVGRDYERYVGYLYESKGWSVRYQGIVEGFADLGRDLIATAGRQIEIVQCKRWSRDKLIHEKHIFQLYGTTLAYHIDNPGNRVKGVFWTSTLLSDRAKQFAEKLGIRTVEGHSIQSYPCIKCNVSRRDGTKIYHLPFDQQYDRTLIEEERLECYVATVGEAESLGFRRAYRWRGSND
jgi:DUF2075 family protein